MYQILDRFVLPDNFRGKPAIIVQLWWIIESTLFSWSPQFLFEWRVFLLRLFGAKIGKKVLIRPSVKITYPWKVTIGDYAWIGDGVTLYSLGNIDIGNNSVISQRSYLCSASHDYTKTTFDIYAVPISIGNSVWIATDVFIGPGITIGDGTVVGTRSTVLNDLPPGKVCFGTPAIVMKDRVISK